MKKILMFSLFVVSAMVSTQVMAGTNSSDEVISDPNKTKVQQENLKKSNGKNYKFTLFNFFGTSSVSNTDTSSTNAVQPKEPNENLSPKIAL